MTEIHPTAIVASEAVIEDGVSIGPYAVIGSGVHLGEGTRVMAHVVIDGNTRIGPRCNIFPFASIGLMTQDLKYRGGTTYVEVGAETTIREYVTINSATSEGGVTRVGSRCLLMAYSHVAHDCYLGDGVILANCGTLAGHVCIEDEAIVGGLSGVHQFVRIGRMAMVGGCSKVTQDIPPFMLADGHPAAVRGVNVIGLQRKGVHADTIQRIKKAHRILFRSNLTVAEALQQLEEEAGQSAEVRHLCEFVRNSSRGIAR